MNDGIYFVTKIKRLRLGSDAIHTFVAKDGVIAMVNCVNYLPFAVHRLFNGIATEQLPVMHPADWVSTSMDQGSRSKSPL